MARKAYARRYAQAVFELAREQKELERWQSDLQKLAGAVGEAGFLAVLESPKLKLEDKNRLLSERLAGVNPLALNLVRLLITRASVGMVRQIAEEYQRLLDSYHGIEPAEVITAIPLDEKEMQRLTESLGNLVGRKVVVKSRVDPGVIGGMVARVGGKLLDGSTRSKLLALRRELVGAERKRS